MLPRAESEKHLPKRERLRQSAIWQDGRREGDGMGRTDWKGCSPRWREDNEGLRCVPWHVKLAIPASSNRCNEHGSQSIQSGGELVFQEGV